MGVAVEAAVGFSVGVAAPGLEQLTAKASRVIKRDNKMDFFIVWFSTVSSATIQFFV